MPTDNPIILREFPDSTQPQMRFQLGTYSTRNVAPEPGYAFTEQQKSVFHLRGYGSTEAKAYRRAKLRKETL